LGAICALLLLLLFIGGISVNLWYGRQPPCHCFGQLYSKPVGPTTLVRNGALAAAASFIVWQGEPNNSSDFLSWINVLAAPNTAFYSGVAVIGLLVGAVIALLWQIILQQGRLLLRLDALEQRIVATAVPAAQHVPTPALGLPVGTPAPDLNLIDLHGEMVRLPDVLAPGRPALLLFTNPFCGPCQALLPDIVRWQREFTGLFTLVLVGEGSAEDNQAKITSQGTGLMILLQRKREVAESYQAWGTPAAVLLRSDGSIGSALAAGADPIRALVAQLPTILSVAAQRSAAAPVSQVAIGDSAPTIPLRYLDHRRGALKDFRGREILVIFWNPNCGFCRQMLPSLHGRETVVAPRKPELVIVSGGTEEEIRAMQLKSTVLLDPEFALGSALGVRGTPMGMLFDAEGRVASPIASGAQAILNLFDSSCGRADATAVA
jgi:thiol-disulfide isomerase/thioredoxin